MEYNKLPKPLYWIVNIFNIDNLWEYVKEITDEEQLNLLKEVLE